jgi:hypothetical protein
VKIKIQPISIEEKTWKSLLKEAVHLLQFTNNNPQNTFVSIVTLGCPYNSTFELWVRYDINSLVDESLDGTSNIKFYANEMDFYTRERCPKFFKKMMSGLEYVDCEGIANIQKVVNKFNRKWVTLKKKVKALEEKTGIKGLQDRLMDEASKQVVY